ncbi:MAG: hemolysin family protein [Bacteroidetes bacterium]|nr:hemolysin family protein [Bacteroidota bacterium]
MSENIWIYILITLVLSAFFSGIEIAYLAANRLHIELKSQKGNLSAKALTFFIKNPGHFLTTTLIGNNIALIMYGVYSAVIMENLLRPYGINESTPLTLFMLQTVVSSFIVLFLAEFIPKAIFRSSANTLLTFLAIPLTVFYYVLYPLVITIESLSRVLLKYIFRVKISKVAPVYSRHDLMSFVTESRNQEKEDDVEIDSQIFKNAIQFRTVKVRDCMIPRTEIEAIEVTDSIENLKEKFTATGHSKIIVYREEIDNIIGYAHLVDLFETPASIDKIVMPIIIATENMPAQELMKTLIEKHRSMALVVDEFGGTSGIITIEDIIEEITGEIEDEHDVDDTTEKKIDENEYIFSARLEIDYLNEKYNLNLPKGDYETLGGLILQYNQSIPEVEEVISLPPFEFTILSLDKTRINEVKLHFLEKDN